MTRPVPIRAGAIRAGVIRAGVIACVLVAGAPARASAAVGDSLRAAARRAHETGRSRARQPGWAALRAKWLVARAERRAARWTGSLDQIVAAQRAEAAMESLYLDALAAAAPEPRAGLELWRAAALDALEDGRTAVGERILAGPLRSDPELLALGARAALSRGDLDSGLALLAWPPDRRGGPHLPLNHPALFVAAALADSAGRSSAARAAYWTILESDPSAAARRTARLRLAGGLLGDGEPRLALAVIAPEEDASVEAALLAASARGAIGDSASAASRLASFASTRGLPTADRYAAAMRAAAWTRGRLADSLDERVWMGLLRTLDYVGEAPTALALIQARRVPPPDSAAALDRADAQATLLARARRHDAAATAFARLLARRDRPAADRAKWALGLARARRSVGAFAAGDSAFVLAATLDSAGTSGESAAWERAREWENRRSGREAAPIFAWAVPRIRSAPLAEAARLHEAVNWLRAGAVDTARVALERMGPASSMGRFWVGRLALLRGDSASARAAFADAWRLGPWSYEGLRAAEELRAQGRWRADSIPFRVPAPSRRVLAADLGGDAPLRARLWNTLGYVSLARETLQDCARVESGGGGIGPCAAALEELGFFRVAAAPGETADLRAEYPPAYPLEVFASAAAESLDPGIIWSIMRQESGYARQVRSRAGAMGLLQLLPKTAARVARRPVSEESLLVAPVNVALGARYLADLDREMGDPRATFGAYNAGEDVVRRWVAEQGPVDDRWVEMIPYRETRDYVKQVYATWRRYEALYGTKTP